MGVLGELRRGGGTEGGCKSALTRSRSVGKNSVTRHSFKGDVRVCVWGGGGGGGGVGRRQEACLSGPSHSPGTGTTGCVFD